MGGWLPWGMAIGGLGFLSRRLHLDGQGQAIGLLAADISMVFASVAGQLLLLFGVSEIMHSRDAGPDRGPPPPEP